MSGFGSLYYTDCLPGQGLHGSAGFQFQAATPGIATEAMPLVQRSALYEPPASWMRERRAVRDYPLSLAHTAADGVYATAAGRYLGQEAKGSRQGNQFTHAVVTTDVKDYGALRPAQLWGAQWWATGAAPGTELAETPPQPVPGPLDTETVRERIRDTEGGESRLIALLSAIERLAEPDLRQTVVLVSADPEEAACWIAAATLLLPQLWALRVSFKIFVADPQYGQHDIVALHPELAGHWADTGAGRGLAVFDLDRGQHTVVEPTEAARFWVPRFLTQDAFDVLDAVELAGELARERGVDAASEAERVVSLLVDVGEALAGPDQLEQVSTWLLEAPATATELVREPVLDAVLAASPQARVLRTLAAAASSRGWHAASTVIRAGLLTAEINEALAAPDGVAAMRDFGAMSPLQRWSHPPGADHDPVGQVEGALRAVRRPDQVPALLAVAARHGIRPAPAKYPEAADSFARWWVANTGSAAVSGLDLASLPTAPEALGWVRRVLHQRIRSRDHEAAINAIHTYWWEPLLRDARDPADPLDGEVFQAAYERLDPERALKLLGRVQDAAQARPGRHPVDVVAWGALFGNQWPSMAQVRDFVTGLVGRQVRVSPDVLGWLGQVADREPTLTEDVLWLSRQLAKLGLPLSPSLAEASQADDTLLAAIAGIRKDRPDWNAKQLAAMLDATPRLLLKVRKTSLTEAFLDAPAAVAVDVLLACRPAVMLEVLQGIESRWPRSADRVGNDECHALALSFLIINAPPPSDRQYDLGVFANKIAEIVKRMSPTTRRVIESSYRPGLGEPWRAWLAKIDAGRLKRLGARLGLGTRSDGGVPKASKQQPEGEPGKKHAKPDGSRTKGWRAGKGGA